MDVPAPKRLPPLNALRAFEVAGRLGSVRRAAAELVVTPGAVSRQVRTLESWLGVPLFRHEGRNLQLTAAGAHYLEVVSEHLSAIARATDELTGQGRREESLHVRAYTLFATNWLIPRLSSFRQSQPWVALELMSSSRIEDFGRCDVDAEIRPGEESEWPGFDSDRLVADEVVVVCSPSFQEKYQLRDPLDLTRLPSDAFIRSIASPQLWERWFERVGLTGLDANRGPSFGDSSLTCRAAAAGQGVGLAPLTFVEADLATNRLVTPFLDARGPLIHFHLVYPSNRHRTRAFSAFRSWLLAEVAAATVPPQRTPSAAGAQRA